MSSPTTNYLSQNLPPQILEKLEAAAFRQLCTHLQERSDEVQNIDLMTISGFCRNCLAKWLVMEARKLEGIELPGIQKVLDALGYDEAAQYVYGCEYSVWKRQHAKKASDEQMGKFNSSKPLWAKHDKEILATKAEKPSTEACIVSVSKSRGTSSIGAPSSLLSNVCCQDEDENINPVETKKARTVSSIAAPAPPQGGISIRMAILTVSDRASANLYETGDLSGPAVEESVQSTVRSMTSVSCEITHKAVVADEITEIQTHLKKWSSTESAVDIIFTTGGTGFAPRDITPEATIGVLDNECRGLMPFVISECSLHQPLASLSRGTAGVLGNTMIMNLPGNPKGVGEIIPVALPLLLHAAKDLQTNKYDNV